MIKTFFPTAILIEKKIIPQYTNEEIKDYVLLKEKLESKDLTRAWHSSYDILDNPPACMKVLFDEMKKYVEEFYSFWTEEEELFNAQDPIVDDPDRSHRTKDYLAWILVQKDKDYLIPHVHPHATFSCTYYCQVPDGDGKDGTIEFLNPVGGMTMSLPYRNTEMVNIRPENGMLLIFPSYLNHWVHPIKTDKDRITIGLDVKVNIEL